MREKQGEIQKIEGLSDLQQELHEFLLKMAKKKPDTFISRKEILLKIKGYGYKGEENLYNAPSATELGKDIQFLKTSGRVDKAILPRSGAFGGVKYATSDEELRIIRKRALRELVQKAYMYRIASGKTAKNGQISFDFFDEEEEGYLKEIRAIVNA